MCFPNFARLHFALILFSFWVSWANVTLVKSGTLFHVFYCFTKESNFHRKQKLEQQKDKYVICNVFKSPCTFVYYRCKRLVPALNLMYDDFVLFDTPSVLDNTRSKHCFLSSFSTDCWQHLISVVPLCNVIADLQRINFVTDSLAVKMDLTSSGLHLPLIWLHKSGLRWVTRLQMILVLFLWKKDLASSL